MINKKKTADDDFRLNSIKIGQGSELSDIESQIIAKVNDKTPAEIASDLGVSVRTVQRHLKRLRESGVIEKMSKRQRRKLGLPTDLRIPYYMVNPSSWVKIVTGVLPGKIESIESVNELDLIFDLIHGLETK
ncbi:MAG: winged helix-turn-helix domain-containing protein, partial [Thermoplasmatales archaeon]